LNKQRSDPTLALLSDLAVHDVHLVKVIATLAVNSALGVDGAGMFHAQAKGVYGSPEWHTAFGESVPSGISTIHLPDITLPLIVDSPAPLTAGCESASVYKPHFEYYYPMNQTIFSIVPDTVPFYSFGTIFVWLDWHDVPGIILTPNDSPPAS